MKKISKIIALMISTTVLLTLLVGCGTKKEVSESAKVMPIEGSVKDALKGVELSVGTSGLFAPFSYYDQDGKTLIGYDMDFMKALQDFLEFSIKDDTVAVMDYSALTTSVAEGRLDVAMAALCATDTRKQVMNFSDTYYDSALILTINKEKSPKDIIGFESIKSTKYKVAVEKGTASRIYRRRILLKKI